MPVESFCCAALLVSSLLIRSELLRDNAGERASKFWILAAFENYIPKWTLFKFIKR